MGVVLPVVACICCFSLLNLGDAVQTISEREVLGGNGLGKASSLKGSFEGDKSQASPKSSFEGELLGMSAAVVNIRAALAGKALCSTMTCPFGSVQKAEAPSLLCSGAVCNNMDKHDCCKPAATVVPTLVQKPKEAPKQKLSPGETFVLYKHAHLLQQLLAQKQIVAWATGGTLLGAVRNGGIIPHDDDCDFTIFEQDVNKTIEALSSSMTVVLDPVGKQHYMTRYNDYFLEDSKYSNYTSQIDVFVAEWLIANHPMGDPSAVALQHQFGNRSAQLGFTQSLVSKQFGCSTVMVPNQVVSKQYLGMHYGPGWAEEVSCNGTWHDCTLLDDSLTHYDLKHMALPCYNVSLPPR